MAQWGLIASVAAALIALAWTLRIGQRPLQLPLIPEEPTEYCYKRVRTNNADGPVAQCFSVVDGSFHRVWSPDEHEVIGAGTNTQVSEGYVIPGLWDGHGHLMQYGEFLHSVDLFGSESLDDVRSRVKAYLKANPGTGTSEQWLRGAGWDQTAFGRMPTAVNTITFPLTLDLPWEPMQHPVS